MSGIPLQRTALRNGQRIIAKRILNSGFDYDLIALNEVFDEDARQNLVAALKAKYPFIIEKPYSSTGAGRQVRGHALMLFSKFSFVQIPNQKESKTSLFTLFKDAAGHDALAAKGALFARVVDQMQKDRAYNFVITHLQADDGHEQVRKSQLQQIQELIQQALRQEEIDNEDIFLMGDLNINGDQTSGRFWNGKSSLRVMFSSTQRCTTPGRETSHSRGCLLKSILG